MRKNECIRSCAKGNGVYLWEIADKLNISVDTFNRRMRHEMSDPEKEKILNIINEIAKQKGE